MTAIVIERRQPEDDEEIFRLYGEVFGAALSEGSRRRWRWQYLENPEAEARGPAIWVAREHGRILGQYASMPVRLQWGGREVRASWGMDVFLREEARGKGVGARLFTTWSDHVEVALGLGLTPSSYGLFQKLGYRDVGPVPFFRKVLDAGAVARRRLGPVLGPPGGLALRMGLRLAQRERPSPPGAVEVRLAQGFGPEYDTLWERVKSSYAMCARRDRAYLDWKYVRCPHQSYELREARRDGTLVGFAVSRHEDYRGLRLGWITDVFADLDDRPAKDALLGAVLEGFQIAGVARAQAFALNGALGEDLRRRGFRPGPSPMQFCVRSRVDDNGALSESRRWHVTFGDSDMDR